MQSKPYISIESEEFFELSKVVLNQINKNKEKLVDKIIIDLKKKYIKKTKKWYNVFFGYKLPTLEQIKIEANNSPSVKLYASNVLSLIDKFLYIGTYSEKINIPIKDFHQISSFLPKNNFLWRDFEKTTIF